MKAHRYWACRLFLHRWELSKNRRFFVCKRKRCGLTWLVKRGRPPLRG